MAPETVEDIGEVLLVDALALVGDNDFASDDHPFMYHCHMANHEGEGLMGQFLVVES